MFLISFIRILLPYFGAIIWSYGKSQKRIVLRSNITSQLKLKWPLKEYVLTDFCESIWYLRHINEWMRNIYFACRSLKMSSQTYRILFHIFITYGNFCICCNRRDGFLLVEHLPCRLKIRVGIPPATYLSP